MTTIHTTGRMIDEHTVHLVDAIPGTNHDVSVIVHVHDRTLAEGDIWTALAKIRESQSLRGHVPPTREEVDEYIKAERDSWGD